MDIEAGLCAEKEILVEDRFTASHLGSGGVRVYATPMMVLHMEETSHRAVAARLDSDSSTVGASISVQHLAPTPVGMKIRIRSELVKVEGRMLTFKVEAWDEVEKVGEAEHVRAIINLTRFGEKLDKKRLAARLD